MNFHSETVSAAQVKQFGLFQQIVQWLAAAGARRRAQWQAEANLATLRQMDARLLDDIGMAEPTAPAAIEGLAQMNPAVVAATAFSLPLRSRR